MKALDEVIEILENVVKHNYVWFDEKTALMTIETLTDNLQYLRELRYILDNLVWVKPEEKGHWEIRSLLPEGDERTEKMRTLDEVIKAVEEDLECANVSHPETFYDYDNHKDALHYLKEYRSDQIQWEAAREDWNEKWETFLEARERHLNAVKELKRNDPLTWDELRQMEGKPVWIWLSPRIKNTPGSGRWEIIYKFNPIGGNKNLFEMEMESRSRFKRKYQGDLWQAYRKEK